MSICHIFYIYCHLCVLFLKLIKGFEMSLIFKNAESLFQKFENQVEIWAEKVF